MLRRCDNSSPTLIWDEIYSNGYGGVWPGEALRTYERLGLLRETIPTREITPFECVHGVGGEPIWSDRPDGTKTGSMSCGDEWCGPHRITPDRMRQWAFSLDVLAGMVGQAIGLGDGIITDVPERIVYLGSRKRKGRRQDVFVTKEAHREDFPALMTTGTRLASSMSAVLMCLSRMPARAVMPAHLSALSLAEVVEFQGSRISIADRVWKAGEVALPSESLVLADEDWSVLEALVEAGEEMKLADLQTKSGYGRRAVDASVGRLLAAAFINRPAGTLRKGVAATEAGVSAVAGRHGPTSPPPGQAARRLGQ